MKKNGRIVTQVRVKIPSKSKDLAQENINRAIRILIALKRRGITHLAIAKSLANEKLGYYGPSMWTIQRCLAGKSELSAPIANRILEVHGKRI